MIPKYRCCQCGDESEHLWQMLAALNPFDPSPGFCLVPAADLKTVEGMALVCGENCGAKLMCKLAGWRAA